jgi:NAD+ kinase
MSKIGIFVKAHDAAMDTAEKLAAWLEERGVEVLIKPNIPAPMTSRECLVENIPKAPPGLSCVVVLGGDGTFLSAIRWIQDTGIPILGMNLGDFGFLTESSVDRLFPIMEDVIKGACTTEERILLWTQVLRDDKQIVCQVVLNDIVINKEALARIAHIQTYIDDNYLTTFKADGLIVATPTGSTAYSLSAGGPIVHPSLQTIIITPICPFTLTNRPLILPDTATIRIKLEERDTDVFLTFDGQVGLPITGHDAVVIRKAPHTIKMLRPPGCNYYRGLKDKLRWGGR